MNPTTQAELLVYMNSTFKSNPFLEVCWKGEIAECFRTAIFEAIKNKHSNMLSDSEITNAIDKASEQFVNGIRKRARQILAEKNGRAGRG